MLWILGAPKSLDVWVEDPLKAEEMHILKPMACGAGKGKGQDQLIYAVSLHPTFEKI